MSEVLRYTANRGMLHPEMRKTRVNPIMQNVSPSRSSGSRFVRSLQGLVCVAGIAVSLGVSAAGNYQTLSQPAAVAANGRPVEAAGVERASASDKRLSLKRALADGRPPSGAEERRQLSHEERRALLQDLRDVTRDLNEGGYSGR
ncbi:MAG: hypothetical protein LPJ91_07585 [Pseudazoarcus pumilus]|nr:hypothetical protein [Pseudazoarcus pumilus]